MTEEITVEEITAEEITAEEIAQHYSACLDSVAVINNVDSDAEIIQRNVEHLKIMLTKDFWTDEDLSPIESAIEA